ncbi:MAG: sigma 54-interacting transcriptional regulator [Deltaproteobacteria bacterium]|nr:sigma 54-interacting transcriptional regulator [Deltaproteobacteria bacterium]
MRPLIDIAQPRLTLTVEQEGGKAVQRESVVCDDMCRIGTHESNDIRLDDKSVSRFHCRLVPDKLGWRLEDLGSLNGTFVSDLRVLNALLPPETAIRIGESVIRIRSAAGERELVPQMPKFGALTGTGRSMRKLFAVLEKVAGSDINCFIHGESGTGKELVATEIVQRGARADKPFVVVDCGAISPTLVESELFGHVRGAFTGADRDRIGAFEAADGGTVFLDEVGELPLAVQPKLLRALEQREVRRVGETKTRKVNVRVISATNRDLEREINAGTFREDLYFRLAVITVRVPRLRDRLEDLPHLIRSFLAQLGAEKDETLFGPEVIEELSRHEWPGNVRELRNYVERSIVLQSARMSVNPPTPSLSSSGARTGPEVDVSIPYKVAKEALVDGFERAYVRAVLEACGGNLTKAARTAGIDRMYLHRLVQKHATRDQLAGEPAPSSRRGGT